MILSKPLIGLGLFLSVAGCVTTPSVQHASRAANYSGAASGESVAAVATGAAAIVAVPLISVGAPLAVSGAALAEVGAASVADGTAILQARPVAAPVRVQPMGPPTLN